MAKVEARLKTLLSELSNRSTFLVVLESLISVSITLFSIVGNVLVLLALYRSPRLRKPSYLYIMSLAVSDVIVSALAMPFTCVSVIIGRRRFGETICWLQASLATMLGCTSLANMTFIAVDRFLKLVHPHLHRKVVSVRTIAASILFAWLLTAMIPLSFYFTNVQVAFHPGHVVCLFDMSKASKTLLTLVAVLGAALPYQVMFFCYYKVWRFIKNHNNQMNSSQVTAEELKLTRLLVIIVGAFTICFVPSSVFSMMDALYKMFFMPREVYFSVTILIGLASCVNPVIYGALNCEFRREFKKIVKREKTENSIEPFVLRNV